MLRVILDTNIYGRIIEDGVQEELKNKLDSMKDELAIYGMHIIRDELRSTAKARYHDGYNLRIALLQLYDKLTESHALDISPLAKSLALLYFKAYKNNRGSYGWREMRNDFLVVAQATISRLDIVVSDDNRTMACRQALSAYNEVNKENNMLTPGIIHYREFRERVI